MGTVARRGDSWRAQVFKRGIRDSGTFATRQQAVDWIIQREAQIQLLHDPDGKTFGEAVAKRQAMPGVSKWDRLRLDKFPKDWYDKPMSAITADVIAEWRDERLKQVKPGTVLRERTLLKGLFTVARKEWKWVTENPVPDVKAPRAPEPRRRRILDAERDAMLEGLGYKDKVESIRHEVAVAFLIALETGMRAGEILALLPEDVKGSVAHVRKSKTGPARDVALSKRAQALFKALAKKKLLHTVKKSDGRLFHIDGPTLDTTFRRVRKAQKLVGFTFHDTRATAITRLSKKLDVRQLARMVGHSDLSSLLFYFAEPADEIAELLD